MKISFSDKINSNDNNQLDFSSESEDEIETEYVDNMIEHEYQSTLEAHPRHGNE